MQSLILAAGKGSRLHPITVKRTKAMLPILGVPMVARAARGFHDLAGKRDGSHSAVAVAILAQTDLQVEQHQQAQEPDEHQEYPRGLERDQLQLAHS